MPNEEGSRDTHEFNHMLTYLFSPVVVTHVLCRRHSLPFHRRRRSPSKVPNPISIFSLSLFQFLIWVFPFRSKFSFFLDSELLSDTLLRTTMKAGKVNHEEDEYDEEDFNSSKKQGSSSAPNNNKGTFHVSSKKHVLTLF